MKLFLLLIFACMSANAATYQPLRGAWWWIVEENNGTVGTNEINTKLNLAQSAKLNTSFFWIRSKYLENMTNGGWDYLAAVNTACAARGITNYLWYGPWTDKDATYYVELRDHPEWAEVRNDAVTNNTAICPTRDEVRAFEYQMILDIMDKYPALAGVDLSEPGVASTSYCYCQICQDYITAHGIARDDLYADRVGSFVSDLRTALNSRGKKLTCDGGIYVSIGSDRRMGRDWGTWATNHWIDFYLPQDYTDTTNQFYADGTNTLPMVTGAGYVPGVGVQWTGPGGWTTNTDTVVGGQCQISKAAGWGGFVLFQLNYMDVNYNYAAAVALSANATNSNAILRNLHIRNASIR